MSAARLGVVLLVACAAVVAFPAAETDDTLTALRKAKTKDERLAAFKGKDETTIAVFVFTTMSGEIEAARKRAEFAEVDRLQVWAEEATALLKDPNLREMVEYFCSSTRAATDHARGRLAAAGEGYQKLRALAKKRREKNPDLALFVPGVLCALAQLQREQGECIAALETIDEAHAEMKALAERELTREALVQFANLKVLILLEQGVIHTTLGDLDAAEKLLKQAEELANRLGNARNAAQARRSLAKVDRRGGRYPEAIAAYTQLLADCRKARERVMEIDTLHDLADALMECGRIGEAIRRLDEARALAEGEKLKYQEAKTLARLAAAHLTVNSDEDAVRYLHTAAGLFEELGHPIWSARCKGLLGLTELLAGKFDRAEKTLAEILAAAKANGDKDMIAHANALIGHQWFAAKEWKQAEESFAAAIATHNELRNTSTFGLRTARLLALAAAGDVRYQKEFVAFKKEALKSDDQYSVAVFAFYDALGAAMEKDWKHAIAQANLAIPAFERERGLVEEPQLQVAHSDAERLPRLHAILATAHSEAGDHRAAFLAIERAKGWVLSRLLDRNGVRIQKGMTPAERKKEEQLRNAVSVAGGKMASQMRTANAVPGRADALAKEQQDAEARSEKFLREVFLAHPELRTQRGELADVDLVALQKVVFAREPDLAILSYLATFDRVLIAVVTAGDKPDGPARVVIRSSPVEEKEMTDAAVGFRDACQASKAGRPVSDDLYRWLIEPAERDIAGKKHGNGLKGGTVLL